MKKVLVYGLSGSGKTTLGDELSRRGYKVIEADVEPGLSSWVNKQTGLASKPTLPTSKKWLNQHEWRWNEQKIHELLAVNVEPAIFVIGGAHNMNDFLDLFDIKIAMHAPAHVLTSRLQAREPKRWKDGAPELIQTLEWATGFAKAHKKSDSILINGDQPVLSIADQVEKIINEN